MPDVDGSSVGRLGSVAMHRGFTHGLVGGVLLMPPLLAGLLWLLDRWQLSRGAKFKSGLPMRFGWLLALAYLATLTHPLMDLLTTYSVQLLAPFSTAWFHADALFIIDVWIWLLLAGSIAWSRIREEKGRPWRRPVQAALGIAIAYIGLNLLISQRAFAAVRHWAGERPVEALFASPPPLESWRRGLAWREGIVTRSRRSAGGGPETVQTQAEPAARRAGARSGAPQTRPQFLPLAICRSPGRRTRCSVRGRVRDPATRISAALGRRRENVVPTGGRR